jgi:hypothetical protein
MQFPTLAAILSLAAFGVAQGCTHGKDPLFIVNRIGSLTRHTGDYNCGFHNSTEQAAIFICNNGQKHLAAICARNCEVINGLPYCK